MDSTKFLTGAELEQLYLSDPSNDHLKNQENLKTLLNHVLKKNMRELTDSDKEILDFCQAGLHPEGFLDETKIQFLRDKYAVIAEEKKKQRIFRNVQKIAACFVFVVVGGVLAFTFSGIESEAGIFDWVKDLFIEEDGEQLVISTPDATMQKIEMKEGHLPDRLPDEFKFKESYATSSSASSVYHYLFTNPSEQTLLIEIKELNDSVALYENKLEIDKSSTKQVDRIGRTYYYITNMERNRISWISDLSIYSIDGVFSFTELEQVLSYYEQEIQ